MSLFKTYLRTCFPETIQFTEPRVNSVMGKKVMNLSLALVGSMALVFMITYVICLLRYNPEVRSLNLPESSLLLIVLGGGSAFTYHTYGWRKLLYLRLRSE